MFYVQGPISLSDVKLEECNPAAQDEPQFSDSLAVQTPLSWKELITSGVTYQVKFDMVEDLINPLNDAFSIKKNMNRKLQYRWV